MLSLSGDIPFFRVIILLERNNFHILILLCLLPVLHRANQHTTYLTLQYLLMSRNRNTGVTSFAIEVRRNLRSPMLRYFGIWCAVSLTICIVALCGAANIAVASLCGSLLSLFGTILILFSGIKASKTERNV